MNLSQYARWDIILISIALAIVFCFEMLGVFHSGKYITITAIVRQMCPKWAIAMVWGWMLYHFIIQ